MNARERLLAQFLVAPGEAARIAERLAARHGDRFAPPALLREMAERGESFYGRFGGTRQAA